MLEDSFQGCLRFRSKGDFVDCDQCTALKLEIKKSRKQYSALIHASQALSLHYKNVSKSRDIEEALRSLPPTSTKPVLFLTTDGMDQSFWSLPTIQHDRCAPTAMQGARMLGLLSRCAHVHRRLGSAARCINDLRMCGANS